MKMVRTVIFDMDGVIIDSEHLHKEVEQELFQELGVHISAEEHNKFVGTSSKDMWQAITAVYHLSASVEDLVVRSREMYQHKLSLLPDIQPIAGVVDLMDQLKENGFKMVLASSSQIENIELVLSLFRLKPYFSCVISGATLPHSKPHPLIFLEAARLATADPKECVVIEDSANGVAAAKAAGMKCIGYRNINSGYQGLDRADLVIDSFFTLTLEKIRSL